MAAPVRPRLGSEAAADQVERLSIDIDLAAARLEEVVVGEKSIEVICLARTASVLVRKLERYQERSAGFKQQSTLDGKTAAEWFRSVVKTSVISTNIFFNLNALQFTHTNIPSPQISYFIGLLREYTDITNKHVNEAMTRLDQTDSARYEALKNKREIFALSVHYRDAILDFAHYCRQATDSLTRMPKKVSPAQLTEALALFREALQTVMIAQHLYRPPVDFDRESLFKSRTPIENCVQGQGSELVELYQQKEENVAAVVSELNDEIQQLVAYFRAGPEPLFKEKGLDPEAQEIIEALRNALSKKTMDGLLFNTTQSLTQMVSLGIYLNRQWKEKNLLELKQEDLASDPTLFSMLMLVVRLIELRRDLEDALKLNRTGRRIALSEGAGKIHDALLAFVNRALPEEGVEQLFDLVDADFGRGRGNLQSIVVDSFKRDPLFHDA